MYISVRNKLQNKFHLHASLFAPFSLEITDLIRKLNISELLESF